MKTGDTAAALRPRPCGPPLRGRATLRGGITYRRLIGCQLRETQGPRLHLKFAGPWSKNGGRRSDSVRMFRDLLRIWWRSLRGGYLFRGK